MHELSYLAATWLCLFTQLFGWALLAGQVVAGCVFARTRRGQLPRLIQLQALVTMLGLPHLAHSLRLARRTEALDGSALHKLQDFVNFGFLVDHNRTMSFNADVPWHVSALLTLLALTCLLAAFRAPARWALVEGPEASQRLAPLLSTAVGMSLVVAGQSFVAPQRVGLVRALSLAPLLVVGLISVASRLWPLWERGGAPRVARRVPESLGLMLTLAFVPTGLLLVTHLAKPVATDRGMILFTPFLLAALAHGVWILTRRRIAGALIVTALVGAFALSIVRFRARQGPNDYRGLATRMATLFENADRIFVRPIDWVSTPLYYHLGRDTTRLVATEYREFVCKFAPRRVWVPEFSDRLVISDITMALRGYRQDTTVVAHNARATLYTRD